MIHINDVIDRFIMIVLPDCFDSTEVVFDRIKIRRIGSKKEECSASGLDELSGFGPFMDTLRCP